MSKLQKTVDNMLPALGVVVRGEYLRQPPVIAFFIALGYREYPSGKDSETVLAEIGRCENYTIWCSIADDHLPFGPTLTVQAGGERGKITIPWNQIIAIVQLHEPMKAIGFEAHS